MEPFAPLLLSSSALRVFSEKMGAVLLSWRHAWISFSLFRAVYSIVQRCKSMENTYALRGKTFGRQKKEESIIHSLQRMVTDYRTWVCSSVFAEPCEKYYKVGCISRVTSELSPVLLHRSGLYDECDKSSVSILRCVMKMSAVVSVQGPGFSSSTLKHL